MFVRIKSRPHTEKKAVQIVKSFREGSKVKQKVIQTIGYAFDNPTLDKLIQVANHVKISLEINENPTLFDPDELIESSISHYENNKKEQINLNVNLHNIREKKSVITGFHQIYGKIYDQIGFREAYTKKNENYLKIIKDIVLARLAKPSSKRETVSMLNKDFSMDLDISKVYRAMDRLDDKTISKIQKQGFNFTQSILGKKVTIAYYDCTTLYFESFKSDELKKLGYSKDCKFNQPQVLLSLFITEEGLPLGYEVYPGNTFEGHTLIDSLEKLKKDYDLKEITIIADSGLLSNNNILKLKEKGYKYILGSRIKALQKSKKEEVLEGIEKAKSNSSCDYITKYYDTSLENKERLIIRYSSKRAEKDKKDREQNVEKLLCKLAKSSSPKSFMSNYGYIKYLDYKGEIDKVVLNEKKLENESKWDGLSGIVTNIKDKKAQELLGYYRELWQIESCFRLQKHDLKIRPIYHWNARRVKSHINICYQAFSCQQYIKYRLKLQGYKISSEQIRKSLLGVRQTILEDIETKKMYAIPSKLDESAKNIYQIMRQKYNNVPYELD
jgi:transposase